MGILTDNMHAAPQNLSPLTPAERLVLLDPNKPQGRAAIKVTLLHLLSARLLRAEEQAQRGKFRTTRTTRLVPVSNLPKRDMPPHVLSLLGVIRAAGTEGLEIKEFVRRAREAYGSDLEGFRRQHLLPALVARGLVEARAEKFMLVFTRTRYRHTLAGEAERRRIEQHKSSARSIPDFLDRDRRQVAALAFAAGSTLLLVEELKPHYKRISETMRQHPAASDAGAGYTDSPTDLPEDAPEENPLLDAAGDFDFGVFDAAALDALDSGLESFDSSFDSSASDGGGSDGGGDGGGGGGE